MRTTVAVVLGLATGIFAFAAGTGLTGSWLAATLIGGSAASLVGILVHRGRIVVLDEAAAPRGLRIVSGLAAVLALVVLGRLAVFMVDPAQVAYSFVPSSNWELRHSCLSAYFVAAEAAGTAPNIYADSLYTMPGDDPTKLRNPKKLGLFNIDVFEYPPPFLLLPRALRAVAPDFTRHRALWFGLNGAIVLIGLLAVARFMGPTAGTRALLLSPLVLAAFPTLSTLQKGNVQAVVIAASILAMLLFERGRPAAGGALLAFVTASKLYPGLLIVYLIVRRQWRALGWTIAFGLAFVLLSIVDMGWAPYVAFLSHLPGLVGGEAFPAFRNPGAIAINFSVPGLVFKLKLFGLAGMGFGAAKIVGWIYTLVALAATVAAGRRTFSDVEKPIVWMAILILATLRSPFLPQAYAVFPPLWLLTLLAALYVPTPKVLTIVLLAWASLDFYWPLDWAMDPRLLAIFITVVPQSVTVALAVFALRRRRDPEAAPARGQAALAGPVSAAARS